VGIEADVARPPKTSDKPTPKARKKEEVVAQHKS